MEKELSRMSLEELCALRAQIEAEIERRRRAEARKLRQSKKRKEGKL